MYQIRIVGTEFVIGLKSQYSGLFTCYDCFDKLSLAKKAILKYSRKYEIVESSDNA